MYPRAGGQYVYLREAFGTFPAFLYGWTCGGDSVRDDRGGGGRVWAVRGRRSCRRSGPVPFAVCRGREFCAAVLGCHGGGGGDRDRAHPTAARGGVRRLAADRASTRVACARVRAIQTSVTFLKAGAVIALVLLAVTLSDGAMWHAPPTSAAGHFFAHPPTASPYLLVSAPQWWGVFFDQRVGQRDVRRPPKSAIPRGICRGR